ncbi:hypothetical protein V6N11_025587 [Hibiscus sabdariffa]|uniref:Uncharacterized protein n=1 Tax=Hibiscus sabdariffa TaxID=183260 RepID=A0ABR2STE5_9ROSI
MMIWPCLAALVAVAMALAQQLVGVRCCCGRRFPSSDVSALSLHCIVVGDGAGHLPIAEVFLRFVKPFWLRPGGLFCLCFVLCIKCQHRCAQGPQCPRWRPGEYRSVLSLHCLIAGDGAGHLPVVEVFLRFVQPFWLCHGGLSRLCFVLCVRVQCRCVQGPQCPRFRFSSGALFAAACGAWLLPFWELCLHFERLCLTLMSIRLGHCLSRYLGGPCCLGAACHGRWPVRLPFPMRMPWLAYARLATQFYDLHYTRACFGSLSLAHSWPECHITWQASFPLWVCFMDALLVYSCVFYFFSDCLHYMCKVSPMF